MKDVFAAFGSEVFRPLVTLFLPGMLAVCPWIFAVGSLYPRAATFAGEDRLETTILVVLAALFIGLLCEDVGSELELVWDKRLDARNGQHTQEWYDYLRLTFQAEPIGHRYLRTILLRFKFELGTSIGAALSLLGIWWLPITYGNRAILSGVVLAILAFCYHEAHKGHELLSRIRHEILLRTSGLSVRQGGSMPAME